MHQRYRLRALCIFAVATVALPEVCAASPWPTDAGSAQSAEVATPQAAFLQVTLIYFNPTSARLSADGKDDLDEVALTMKEQPASRLQITCYLMPGEPDLYQLSLRRAESVRAYLVTRHGIDPARMATSRGMASQEQTDSLDEVIIDRLKKTGVAVLTLSEE
jgi:outer membrane protein OmpA-like peptidoglycan-associated protein